MKFTQLLIGLLLGGLLGFGLTKYFTTTRQQADNTDTKEIDTSSTFAKWTWPDSLDAVKAAPENHKIVYEDSTVRILQVFWTDTKKNTSTLTDGRV